MDRYEVMAGKMAPLTDGAHRKWGFTGKVETRSYERLVDALIDFGRISQLTGRKPRGAGVRACEERVSGMAGTQGRPLIDMNSICFDTETTGLHPNGSDPD